MNGLLPDHIESPRLLLRVPQAKDAAQIFEAYTQDAAVAHWMIWQPHVTVAETEAFIRDCIQVWPGGARLPFVLALRGSEAL